MDRQTVVAFVLIGAILIIWMTINSPDPQEQEKPADTEQTEEKTPPTPPRDLQRDLQRNTAGNNQVPQDPTIQEVPEQVITIDTKLAKMEITNRGARIRKYYLKKYKTWYHRKVEDDNFYDNHVQLVNSFNGGDFNIEFVSRDGRLINTEQYGFNSNADNYKYNIENGDSLSLSYAVDLGNGRKLTKRYTFYGNSYSIKVDVVLENLNDFINGFQYNIEWSNGLNFTERNSVDEANYSNAAAYSGDELVSIDASGTDETEDKEINGKVDWVGVKTKYFAAIIAPESPSKDGGAYMEGYKTENGEDVREYYKAGLKTPFFNSNYQKDVFDLYIGPLDYDTLSTYNNNYTTFYDFGSFLGLKFITRPISEYILLPLFQFLHTFIPNYGFVIIVFTIILKIVLLPFTRASYKSMKKMQLLQPKIQELKEKYKDDQQRQQKETMSLYRNYGVNPAGGCLPMVLQMPILFALFTFFNVTIEIRQEPFILWIDNLSAPDVLAHLPFAIPFLGIDYITGLAPLLGISMFIQQKMSVKDPSQKALVYIMPFMFTFMFMGFSSGLNLYYFLFNLFSIVQQQIINKTGEQELKPVEQKPGQKKKKGFMERMMEAAEQQQKAQKEAQKKGGNKTKKNKF